MEKILVVVDMQKDFVDGALGSKEAVAIVENVAEKIAEFDGKIFVTYDTHETDYMETREGKYLPVPHCIKDTDGWQLNEKVQEALKGKTYEAVYKPTFGSVKLPELVADYIKNEKDTDVTLIGVCTDICVVSNAMLLKAHYPEMNINVVADCCAGVTPEKHEAALEVMRSCQINVL